MKNASNNNNSIFDGTAKCVVEWGLRGIKQASPCLIERPIERVAANKSILPIFIVPRSVGWMA